MGRRLGLALLLIMVLTVFLFEFVLPPRGVITARNSLPSSQTSGLPAPQNTGSPTSSGNNSYRPLSGTGASGSVGELVDSCVEDKGKLVGKRTVVKITEKGFVLDECGRRIGTFSMWSEPTGGGGVEPSGGTINTPPQGGQLIPPPQSDGSPQR